jgi:hypothetical protein
MAVKGVPRVRILELWVIRCFQAEGREKRLGRSIMTLLIGCDPRLTDQSGGLSSFLITAWSVSQWIHPRGRVVTAHAWQRVHNPFLPCIGRNYSLKTQPLIQSLGTAFVTDAFGSQSVTFESCSNQRWIRVEVLRIK